MEIKVETNYTPLVHGNEGLPVGIKKRVIPTIEYRSIDSESIAIAVFSFTAVVTGKVLASWIYDKIKRFKDKPDLILKINEREVTKISEEELTIVIEREIELSEN